MSTLSNKKRLDNLLVELNIVPSREKAKTLIMAGLVYVDNQKCDKAGSLYPLNSKIEVRGKAIPFVSRGGLKLDKAIKVFNINLTDKICMDIGASTGGFTDCMLQNGALKVYAVDVGYGQLDWKLRNDNRVINLERTNIRYLEDDKIEDELDFFSIDVSFISLKLCLPVARKFLNKTGKAVCLIKPQFEAGRESVGKKGVVRDPKVHIKVINDIKKFALNNGFNILNLDFSPIKGPQGNIEYLILLEKSDNPIDVSDIDVTELVKKSHEL